MLAPLLTPETWELLNALPEYDPQSADQLNHQLRRNGWSPEVVAAALTQMRLRRDARAKFGQFADRMLLTQQGLEQATRLPVAARHAQRFRSAGIDHAADLGCGLGADAMALASSGVRVTAVEADETTAAAATMNLLPFPEAQVVHSTAERWAAEHLGVPEPADEAADADPAAGPATEQLPEGLGVWMDPARRTERGRLWDPEDFSPPLSMVTALARTGVPLGVKLGPGMPHDLIPLDCEAEWVSVEGDLVELVLWFNALARPGARRTATVLTGDGDQDSHGLPCLQVTPRSSADDFSSGIEYAPAGREGLRGVLWEPDPAVIRAGLVAELAAEAGGWMLDEHIAYFCTDASADPGPLARGYRITEVMDFSPKRLKQWCAEQQVTSVEIKKRGVDVVPEQLRRQILPKRRSGAPGRHAVLVLTRLGSSRLAVAVEPLAAQRPGT